MKHLVSYLEQSGGLERTHSIASHLRTLQHPSSGPIDGASHPRINCRVEGCARFTAAMTAELYSG
jgi:hypothetical protein